MIGRKTSAERVTSVLRRLRWTRVATLAAVLLIHLGFLAFLFAPWSGWRRRSAATASAAPDALLVRLLPTQPRPIESPRPSPPHLPRQARTLPLPRRAPPVAQSSRTTSQAAPQATVRSIDSLIATAPPSYVAGGGRLAGADYGRQNVRVPGSSAPIRGMPVFRMADPRMQGLAGVVRFIGHLTGAVDPHCVELERQQAMTVRERIDRHVDTDDAQMAAIAARYGCSEPLKPGAAMYNFYRPRQVVGAH